MCDSSEACIDSIVILSFHYWQEENEINALMKKASCYNIWT